jgi:hypothetical protein
VSGTLIQEGGSAHYMQVCMRETTYAYKIFVCRPQAHGWEGDIKLDFIGRSSKDGLNWPKTVSCVGFLWLW